MPRQQDDESPNRSRNRAGTTSFPSFSSWKKGRPETQPPTPPAQPLPVEALIEALTPPSVPSINHARSLASVLASHTPVPPPAALNSVLANLCNPTTPEVLQAAGFDILSAYWENNDAATLSTADRLAYFSLFLTPSIGWSKDIWEPRFRALRTLTKFGTVTVGVETSFLNVLKTWIQDAFEWLVSGDSPIDQAQRTERERTVEVIAAFLTSVSESPELVARIPERELYGVLSFYAGLVDQSITGPSNTVTRDISMPSSPLENAPSHPSTPARPANLHRRHPSSLSVSSLSQSSSSPPTPLKHPADLAVTVYLNHLTSQVKTLSPSHLDVILPLLFRSLAFHATPLPRLSITLPSRNLLHVEHKITEMLDSLLSGPYSALCMMILKQYLSPNLPNSIQTSIGAHRSLRNYIRRGLCTRLARAYISQESNIHYAPSGAPSRMDMERDLMERAWPKDDVSLWDASKLGRVLCKSVEAWVGFYLDMDTNGVLIGQTSAGREKILEEAAGTLKDVLQEIDSREDDGNIDEEEASAVGETLHQLASYILPLKNSDGTPLLISLTHPTSAPTTFLRILSSLLSRDHLTYLNPPLSATLLLIADHLTDADTAKLPVVMSDQHDLSPTSPEWLTNWEMLLANPTLLSHSRPLTRQAVMHSLQSVYASVKDMPSYRKPLANLILDFCQRQVSGNDGDDESTWGILGDEVVLRTVETQEGYEDMPTPDLVEADKAAVEQMIELLTEVAKDRPDDDDTTSAVIADQHSLQPATTFSTTADSSTTPSPIGYRMQADSGQGRDQESGMPSVMSILASLATGNSSRSQSVQPQSHEDPVPETPISPSEICPLPRAISAVVALVSIFSQLSFTPFVLSETNLQLAIRIYNILINLVAGGRSGRTRLTVLQFLMRLRADRDHRLYFVDTTYDPDGHILSLASLVDRVGDSSPRSNDRGDDGEILDFRRARPRFPQRRAGRRASRGGGRTSISTSSRSRSRLAATLLPSTTLLTNTKPREPIWQLPESLPFFVPEVNTPSEALVSYDPAGPDDRLILPISAYLLVIIDIIGREKNWEILSYVLCHLPVQLANKHLFCGPKSREFMSKLHFTLSTGIINGQLACEVDRWPHGCKPRDAQGLAYHTLSVLLSYRRCFDVQHRHLLLEVFETGLNSQQPSTVKCCLHALTLAAFEFPTSMTKYLSRILEKLSQIMSNPDMAVHILGFLSIVCSVPPLHANFTEADFKMVFGVALQYLQHHNHPESSPTSSWALSQHVRIISFYVVYAWFLAVRLPDRPRHVRFITRQLLLANEGRDRVDDATEVCFDWLARYTYASADPRPANSLLNDVVMNPTIQEASSEIALSEKSWISGNSVVTIRGLARLGWMEILSRRPSGLTKFLCRVENVPMVGPGDVDLDELSIPASLMMEHDLPKVQDPDSIVAGQSQAISSSILHPDDGTTDSEHRPDPITGYVWSGSAPSQRRKKVAVDPAFMVLQLSSYPDLPHRPTTRPVVDQSALSSFVRTLDRMPVIDTHKVGIMYVAPGQTQEQEILRNTHGSPAYTRFLEGIGRLINLRGQADVYAGGLDPDEDGEYAYAWWDDIGQILYHTATMMPSNEDDPHSVNKKRHIGNDYVRIVWNDSGLPYRFDTLATQFQFVNIVIEPHSFGSIAAFSNNLHENEYFKVNVQQATGMPEFMPTGDFKLMSAENLPLLARQLSLLADWFASVFERTQNDTVKVEMTTNWQARLQAIRRFREKVSPSDALEPADGVMGQELMLDFTTAF